MTTRRLQCDTANIGGIDLGQTLDLGNTLDNVPDAFGRQRRSPAAVACRVIPCPFLHIIYAALNREATPAVP